VLQKLVRLPAHELARIDGYLSLLIKRNSAPGKQKAIVHLTGAWKNWDEHEFEDFLQSTRTHRQNMLALRSFDFVKLPLLGTDTLSFFPKGNENVSRQVDGKEGRAKELERRVDGLWRE